LEHVWQGVSHNHEHQSGSPFKPRVPYYNRLSLTLLHRALRSSRVLTLESSNTSVMHSVLSLIALLGAAGMASAEVFDAGLTPTSTRAPALAKRETDRDCATSVSLDLLGPSPKNDELIDWALDVVDVAACTVTAPASLSSAYTSWFEELTEWAEDIEDRASKQTDCGYDSFTLTFTGNCPEDKRTVLFTGENLSDPTDTHVEDRLPVPTAVKVGAASQSGVTRAGLALAVFVAFTLAL
jgi:hypothetical protein